jgi:hypothetical protein
VRCSKLVSQSESREEELACTTTKEPLLFIYNNNNNNNNKAGKHNPHFLSPHFELVVRLQRKNIINVPHTRYIVSLIRFPTFYSMGNSFPHETTPKKEKKLTLQNHLKKRGTKIIN